MEAIDGKLLSTLLTEQPKLPLSRAIDIILQVLDSLSALHRIGVVHGDLKPDNIKVVERINDYVRPFDFGISCHSGKNARENAWGSWPYMAPEQFAIQSNVITGATDIYALGLISVEILTGKNPGAAEPKNDEQAHKELRQQQLFVEIPKDYPLESEINTIHHNLNTLLTNMLSIRPEDRFTAETLIDKFRALSELVLRA
jgi:serine/threonine protein kinase